MPCIAESTAHVVLSLTGTLPLQFSLAPLSPQLQHAQQASGRIVAFPHSPIQGSPGFAFTMLQAQEIES